MGRELNTILGAILGGAVLKSVAGAVLGALAAYVLTKEPTQDEAVEIVLGGLEYA